MLETVKRYGRLALLVPTMMAGGVVADASSANGQEHSIASLLGRDWLASGDTSDAMEELQLTPVSNPSAHVVGHSDVICTACTAGGGCCTRCARNSWYVSISGGWQHRETVHEANDPQTFIEFDDGFAANAALGYRFNRFRIEAEYSFLNNDVDRAGSAGLESSASGNVNLRALMFNIYHDVDIEILSWKPYLGAGIGLYQSEINSLYPEFFDAPGAPAALNGTAVNTTSDTPFAYQFRIGLTRPLSTKSEFYTGYRYFRGEELEFAALPFSTFAPTFHPEGTKNHSVEFGFRVNF